MGVKQGAKKLERLGIIVCMKQITTLMIASMRRPEEGASFIDVRRAWRAAPMTGAVNRQAKANRDVTWRVQVPLEAVMTGTPS